MSYLSRELVFLIHQFLDEEKYKETLHKLEQESGVFFNMKYFEDKVMAGEWDEVEKYLSGFTKLNDNRYSMKIFFEIRKQKYLEALDRNDRSQGIDILMKELKTFSSSNADLYKEITHLITLDNFRENEQLSKYGDANAARIVMLAELKKLIEANPLFREKLVLPTLRASRLRTLINQSLNWQHQLCKNSRTNPDIKTLFVDHTCPPSNGTIVPPPVTLPVAAVAKPSIYVPLGAHGPFPSAVAGPNSNALAGWMMNPHPSSSVPSSVVAASLLSVPSQVSGFKHPRIPSNTLGMIDYQSTDQEQLLKRVRSMQYADEVTYPSPSQQASSLDDLPRTVTCTMHQGSSVTSMDFHPSLHTLLAVGCANGETALWEVGLRERWVAKPFKIWNMVTCSALFQTSMAKDSSISVSRVAWSLDGKLIGVSFTKHLLHVYAYQGSNDLRQHFEIDAHVGGVNDVAFSYPNKQLCVVTCGDDKLIKVWDLGGRKIFTFEGHEAPVYSICPHYRGETQFLFSTSLDGKIRAWLYDNIGCRVDYEAPEKCCTTMLYSADGSRLFSCGTSKEGESFLVEWSETQGAIKRTYSGFKKKSAGVMQIDTTWNRFLVAGADNQIKYWGMDNTNLLATVEAEGGLPSLPRLKFNKEGNLLAVSTSDNGFKVLANADGLKTLRTIEAYSYNATRASTEMKISASAMAATITPVIAKVERIDSSSPAMPNPVSNGVESMARSIEKSRNMEQTDKIEPWELTEIVNPAHCQCVTASDDKDPASKVVRLVYTNSGVGILSLGSNGIMKLWKWNRSEQNPSGKATANLAPQHWQPVSGFLMTNDVPDNSEEAIPCIALSKNDSYVISASGGNVSLFNMTTFKVMTTFVSPPPASTNLAFLPKDNNIIAIGMEDASIHIYNVRMDQVQTRLAGHQKSITGLAFSTNLNIMVSSGVDAQLLFWKIGTWEKMKSIMIQMPAGKEPIGNTTLQFHSDQVNLLVSHETQLAVYDASKMGLVVQWVPHEVLSSPISCAVYSCNSQRVYSAFTDGNIGVFDAYNLRLRCRIAPSAYISQTPSNGQNVYPLAITAHPHNPNQLSVGLTDGCIKVLEPTDSESQWGVAFPDEHRTDNGETEKTPPANDTNTRAEHLH